MVDTENSDNYADTSKLKIYDTEIFKIIQSDRKRQIENINLIASEAFLH